jgi:stage V sporulation protein G
MLVTEVQILPVKPKDGLVGFASLVVDQRIYVGNIGIYTRPDGSGIRLVFPTKTLPNGLTVSCVHPICREAGQVITNAVAKKMEELASRCGEPQREDRQALASR